MTSQRLAIATKTLAVIAVLAVAVISEAYLVILLMATPPIQTRPCGLNPGMSVVTSNGIEKCIVGPPIAVYDNGTVDFKNGTVINLHANLTSVALLGQGGSGGRNDTVILTNGTRITFNSRGVIVTISPYQGRSVYSNGTITSFPVCRYPINANLELPHGLSGNGTAWWTSSDGTAVRFNPNGTCVLVSSTLQSSTSEWQVVSNNVTIYGLVAGTPCGALRLPCVTWPNQSLSVQLIRYEGDYYYVSNYSVGNNVDGYKKYTIWFTNSTVYCISPKVEWAIACPGQP